VLPPPPPSPFLSVPLSNNLSNNALLFFFQLDPSSSVCAWEVLKKTTIVNEPLLRVLTPRQGSGECAYCNRKRHCCRVSSIPDSKWHDSPSNRQPSRTASLHDNMIVNPDGKFRSIRSPLRGYRIACSPLSSFPSSSCLAFR
jgi:hypothetical protein